MASSSLWMPTSPEATSRTLSPTSLLQSLLDSPKLDLRDSQFTSTQSLLSIQTLKPKPTSDSLISQLDLMRLTSLEPRPRPNSCQLTTRTTSHKTLLLSIETETSLSLPKLAQSSCQLTTKTTSHR